MAKNLQHLASQVVAKPGFNAVVNLNAGFLTVTKNGQTFALRVIHDDKLSIVTVGDGSGVKTGDADAWLNELK